MGPAWLRMAQQASICANHVFSMAMIRPASQSDSISAMPRSHSSARIDMNIKYAPWSTS